jgi:hypothetical protein
MGESLPFRGSQRNMPGVAIGITLWLGKANIATRQVLPVAEVTPAVSFGQAKSARAYQSRRPVVAAAQTVRLRRGATMAGIGERHLLTP